jgi:VWFA-related protein
MRLRPDMALGVILACAVPAAAQVPTISVKTEEVRVDVLVTDHGKPVHGLRAADFAVFDNGTPQKLNFASQEHIPFNTVLVLDMSSSVAGERLLHLRHAGRLLLGELKGDEYAALVTFSHAVTINSKLTNDLDAVKAQLDEIEPTGNTAVIDASYAGLILAESRPGRPLLIYSVTGSIPPVG